MTWTRLGSVAPVDLAEARRHGHWAAQVIASVGETHLEHLPDTSHTTLTWDSAHRELVGCSVSNETAALRVGLALPTLSLRIRDDGGSLLEEIELAGLTLITAYERTAQALSRLGGDRLGADLVHPGYEMPPHPLSAGARFGANAAALAELARWYANAGEALEALVQREPGTPVLCWPHHFDIASLIVEARGADGAPTRTIGVGFSPGDEAIHQPYWYVNHWPEREDPKLGPLAAGRWQTGGFTAAVLEGREVVDAPDPQARLRCYLDSAIAATRSLPG